MANRAILILPYYGKWPWYFGHFLKSVEGKHFDVLLVTDLSLNSTPDNVRLLKMSMDELTSLIAQKLNGPVKIGEPYKLCDFKPMYGRIFEDYIKDYTYWIFGDCDVLFGNKINDFIVTRMAEKCDVVSLRKLWLSGSFCMIRNNVRLNNLYLEARDLKDVFETEKTICFDELGGYWFLDLLSGRMTMDDCRKRKEYFTALVCRTENIRVFMEDVIYEEVLYDMGGRFVSGDLMVNKDKRTIYHLVRQKRSFAFHSRAKPYSEIRDFYIKKTGFYGSPLSARLDYLIYAYRRTVEFFRSGYETLHCAGLRGVVENIKNKVCS